MTGRLLAVALLAGLAATPALAETDVVTARYLCDRDVSLPATFVNAPDLSVVVMTVDGWQITLFGEPAASGARYGWPSDGSNYVWWTKGNEVTLYWKTPEGEAPLLTCKAG